MIAASAFYCCFLSQIRVELALSHFYSKTYWKLDDITVQAGGLRSDLKNSYHAQHKRDGTDVKGGSQHCRAVGRGRPGLAQPLLSPHSFPTYSTAVAYNHLRCISVSSTDFNY